VKVNIQFPIGASVDPVVKIFGRKTKEPVTFALYDGLCDLFNQPVDGLGFTVSSQPIEGDDVFSLERQVAPGWHYLHLYTSPAKPLIQPMTICEPALVKVFKHLPDTLYIQRNPRRDA